MQEAAEATGADLAPYGALGLAAFRGRQDEASALIETTGQELARRGEGIGMTATKWAEAVLNNGLGRYEEALVAAEQGSRYPDELGPAAWSVVELIEAATRTGQTGRAADALRSLSETTSASGTDWALGVEARSRALLSVGEPAELLYRTAIQRLGRTRIRMDLARAHLLYGEWLRRENRRVDAREQLRCAHEMLKAMGAGDSPNAPSASCWLPARPYASARSKRSASLLPRRRRSPCGPVTGERIRRSPPSSSSARARSSGICTRCSASSASPPAGELQDVLRDAGRVPVPA